MTEASTMRRILLACCAIIPSALPAAAAAQDRAQGGGAAMQESEAENEINEIIVTAQKREERLQDVPISITLLGGEALDKSREEGLTEMLRRVPGIAAPVVSLGAPSIAIRGVTADGSVFGGAPTASYYIDAVPFGFVRSALLPDSNLYDLDRIEVLRGPQGTLFGANAQNGVVRILTRDPDLSDFELKGRGSVSLTRDGGTNYRGDLAVNIPLVEDRLAARAVVGYTDRSGWIDRPGQSNIDSAKFYNARLKLEAKPTDTLSLVGTFWLNSSRIDDQSLGNDRGLNTSPGASPVRSDQYVYALRANYDAGAVNISNAVSYFDYSLISSLDLSPLGPFASGLVQKVDFGSRVFSEELNFSSVGDGPWRWSAGASYRRVSDRFIQYFGNSVAGFAAVADYDDRSEAWAVFGELTRTFLDGRLELTGGLRYFEDKQRLDENISTTLVPGAPLLHAEAGFKALTPRAVITWLPERNLTFYASYAQGFRSGLLQQPSVLLVAPNIPPAKPDRLHNYELGAKGSLWDGALQFDAAIYYIDWKDIQQGLGLDPVSGNPSLTAILNGSSASGLGVEYSISLTPVKRLTITNSFSWNGLTFDRDVLSGGVVLIGKGSRLGSSPEYTFGFSANYSFPVGKGYELQASASANYTSAIKYTALTNGIRTPQFNGDSIMNSRASLMLVAPSNWSLTLFVDNLGDVRKPTTRGPFPETWYGLNTRPRTFGLQMEAKF